MKALVNLKNVCIKTDDENSSRRYKLSKKYINNKNYDLIDNFLCENIVEIMDPIDMFFYKKNENFNLHITSIIPIDFLSLSYFVTLRDTEYEIIYNYAESMIKLIYINDFYNVYENNGIYKLKAKSEMQKNYEKQIKYEIVQLEAIKYIIEYFEYNLDNT